MTMNTRDLAGRPVRKQMKRAMRKVSKQSGRGTVRLSVAVRQMAKAYDNANAARLSDAAMDAWARKLPWDKLAGYTPTKK